MDDYPDFDQGYFSPHPVDPPEAHADQPDDGDAPIGLVGYLYAAYDTLHAWLGLPDPDVGDPDKINAEWTLVTPDGQRVYVYDYGDVGWGAADDARERDARARWTTEWHVGAHDEATAQALFGDTLVTCRQDKSHPCALGRTTAVLTIHGGTATVEPLRADARAYVRNALRGNLEGPAEWAATATRQLKGYSVVVLTRGRVPDGLPYGGAAGGGE